MKNIILLISLIIVVGCTTAPVSHTDIITGATTIYTKPEFVRKSMYGGSNLSMGMFWSTQFPKVITLTVGVYGTFNIPKNKSLIFKIDGEVFTFDSIGHITDINYDESLRENFSSRSYIVSIQFFEKMLSAKEVIVQIGGFADGYFNYDGVTTAKSAMIEANKKIQQLM